MSTAPRIRYVADKIIDYYCEEFGIPPTDTYPLELIANTLASRAPPTIVVHLDDDHIVIPAKKDAEIAEEEDSDLIDRYLSSYPKRLRMITNITTCGYDLSDDKKEMLCCQLGILIGMYKKYPNGATLPQAEHYFVNMSMRLLHYCYPTWLYAAVAVKNNHLNLFVYLDKYKPLCLN